MSKILNNWYFKLLVAVEVIFAAAVRMVNLGNPGKVMFDETYYVKDAWTQLITGAARDWPKEPNDLFAAGDVNIFLDKAAYVVHPPFGKTLISLGFRFFNIFGLGGVRNPASWRFSEAVLSVACVFLTVIIAKKLFSSVVWADRRTALFGLRVSEIFALIAGFLLAIDGLSISMARIGILDTGLSFFILLACYFALRDWEQVKHIRWANRFNTLDIKRTKHELFVRPLTKPKRWTRGYLFLTALSLGCAMGVKWSAAYYCVALALFLSTLSWGKRTHVFSFADACPKSSTAAQKLTCALTDAFTKTGSNLRDIFAISIPMAVVVILTYFWDWISWFSCPTAWGRSGSTDLGTVLSEFVKYHQQMWDFHTNLHTPHSYASPAWQWLLNIRPVAFYYDGNLKGCGADTCSSAVTALGNPLIWWLGAACLLLMLVLTVYRANRTANLLLIMVAAGWVPWGIFNSTRTAFYFYSVIFEPYFLIIVAYILMIVFLYAAKEVRIVAGTIIAVIILTLAVVSWYFYPIWVGTNVPYSQWHNRMWLTSWI